MAPLVCQSVPVLLAASLGCLEDIPTPDTSGLSALPDVEYPSCSGRSYESEYYGQCCGEVRCLETDGAQCPAVGSAEVDELMPPGSGECSCSGPEDDFVEGPYAQPATATSTSGDGPCCYVVYEIGCEGRPLRDEHGLVLAPIVSRDDWVAYRGHNLS